MSVYILSLLLTGSFALASDPSADLKGLNLTSTPTTPRRPIGFRSSLIFEPAPIGLSKNFLVRGPKYNALIGTTNLLVASHDGYTPLQLKFSDANPAAKLEGAEKLPGVSNYFLGNDPKQWRVGVPNFSRVTVEDVYPGIDMVYYDQKGELEFDFIVGKDSDPRQIQIEVVSIHQFKIDEKGDLVLNGPGGEFRLSRPKIYQRAHGVNKAIEARYKRIEGNTRKIGLGIADYDTQHPLIIDPVISYTRRLGGTAFDEGKDIAVDGEGHVYVTGRTESVSFPAPENESPELFGSGGGSEAYVIKLAPDGTTILYSTFLGGSSFDEGLGIGIDAEGHVYFAGETPFNDTGFPTTPNAYRTSPADFFIAKLDATGDLLYSTFLGGRNLSNFGGFAVHGTGDNARVYLTGRSRNGFPTTESAYRRGADGLGPFLSVLELAQPTPEDQLIYSTYFVGNTSLGIAVGPEGKAYMVGSIFDLDIPLRHAFDTDRGNGREAFLAIFDPEQTGDDSLIYSTYIGGSLEENGTAGDGGIAVGPDGVALVIGTTSSHDFPVTPEGYRTSRNEGRAFFVAVDPTRPGSASLRYGTYFGGSSPSRGTGIAAGPAGTAYLTGITSSGDILNGDGELAPKLGDGVRGHGQDSFIAKIDWTRIGDASLIDAAYIGGTDVDISRAIAVDPSGNAYITGETSSDAPFLPIPASNSRDSFVAKISPVFQLPDGRVDTTSTDSLTTDFGTSPYTWRIVSGDPPAGLTLEENGILSGNPTEIGTWTFTTETTDSLGQALEQTYRKRIGSGAEPEDILIRKAGVIPIPGRILPYHILVRNRSDHTIYNVEVVELLQYWFQFISSSPPPTELEPRPTGNVYWTIPQMAPGELKVIIYNVTLPPEFPIGIEVSGEACLNEDDCNRERTECSREGKIRCDQQSCGENTVGGTHCTQCNTMEEEQCRQEWVRCLTQVGKGNSEVLGEGSFGGGCNTINNRTRGARDPNEKNVTSDPFIQPGEILGYTIHFENIGNAEARDVFLTDVLDDDLDLSTVQVLRPYGGLVPLLPDTTVTIFNDDDEHWDVTLDSSTRTLTWDLINIDLLPKATDNVFFVIQAPEDLPTGTEIRNESTIQFEVFESLTTNETLNTIDTTPPVALVDPLPEETFTEEFEISWSGTDEVGEIERYAVFVATNDGPFIELERSSTPSSTTFIGEIGNTYSFLSIARDTAGNVEEMDGSAETSTTIVNPSSNSFYRGDPNNDNVGDISDSITIFSYLFLGDPEELSCHESADANNDTLLDITDGIYLLSWLFLGTAEPPAPGPPGLQPCGLDTDPLGSPGDLGCEAYTPCL